MRKIVAGLSISLDGVVESANDWMGPWFNPELGQAIGSLMAAQDAMLLGRVTYQDSLRTGRSRPVRWRTP